LDSLSESPFDLKNELPAPRDAEEEKLLQQVDALAKKIGVLIKSGGVLPEAEARPLLNLQDSVVDSPSGGMALVMVYRLLRESAAQRDLLEKLVKRHGPLPPYLYFRAKANLELESYELARDDLQQLIVSGKGGYEIYFFLSQVQFQMKDWRGAIASANLAVYDNEANRVAPFILMAHAFSELGETNRVLECFSRIEKLEGGGSIERLCPELSDRYGDVYQGVRQVMEGKS
jgi:tetratricopeptide (TPR) repeat protein